MLGIRYYRLSCVAALVGIIGCVVLSGMLTCTGRYRSAWVDRGDAPAGYDRLVSLRLINE
jgi:hypothetical protein